MQRLLLGCLLVALVNFARAQVDNPCVQSTSYYCLSQPQINVAVGGASSYTGCLGQAVSICGSNSFTAGTVQASTVNGDCSVTTTTSSSSSTLQSNWWQVTLGSFSASGSGLCASFTPTNAGTGTLTYYVRYANTSPCSTIATTRSTSVTINVIAENGPHAGTWSKVADGSLLSAGSIEFSNVVVCVGGSVDLPGSYGVTFNNGSKRRFVSYDCPSNTNLNHWQTNAVAYTPSAVYFDPPMPSVFTTAQTNTYTAKVNGIPSDSVCAVISNIVIGTVTVVAAPTSDSD